MVERTGVPIPFFTPANTRAAFQLRFHFAWHTYRKRPILAEAQLADQVTRSLATIAGEHNWNLLESSIASTEVKALLSLQPDTAPSAVTRIVKGNLTACTREYLQNERLWSKGWFVRSNGHVAKDTVRNYVTNQYAHHNAAPCANRAAITLARFHADSNPCELRTQSHSAFEYNVHLVFVTRRRLEFLDLYVAEYLVEYLRRVCTHKGWIAHDLEIVWNHVHLFLGLRPTDAPGDVALSLMNNTAYVLHQRYPGAVRSESLAGIWSNGYYVGTVGSATTAQIKSYLGRE